MYIPCRCQLAFFWLIFFFLRLKYFANLHSDFGIRSVRSHALNFRNVLYNMCHIIRMIFRRALYFKLQFDRLDNLNIAKKVSKSKYCLHLHCFFHPSENPRFFFETRKSKLQQTVENLIKINQCLTFFSDIAFLLFRFLLVEYTNKTRLLTVVKQTKKQLIFTSDIVRIPLL